MTQFLMLARGTSMQQSMSPEEMQAVIQRYRAWTEGLSRSGRLVSANKLRTDHSRVMRRNAGKLAVTDGPFTESKEIVGGYWLVQAKDYEEMVELAKDHPHLQFGELEIRELDDYSGR